MKYSSIIEINPEIPDSQKLKSWYSSESKETSMEAVGSSMKTGGRSMYSDRVTLDDITSKPIVRWREGNNDIFQMLRIEIDIQMLKNESCSIELQTYHVVLGSRSISFFPRSEMLIMGSLKTNTGGTETACVIRIRCLVYACCRLIH